jgi:protein O-GlcNAc transferase
MNSLADLSVEELLDAAKANWKNQKLAEAERACHAVLGQDAQHPYALYMLGRILHATGRAGLAIAFLQAALDRRPDSARFQRGLGRACLERGMLDRAEAREQAAAHGAAVFWREACRTAG